VELSTTVQQYRAQSETWFSLGCSTLPNWLTDLNSFVRFGQRIWLHPALDFHKMNRNWCGKWFRNVLQGETAPFRPNLKDDRFRSEISSIRVRFNPNFCKPFSSQAKCFWKVAYRFLWTPRGCLWLAWTSTTQFSILVLFETHIGSSSTYLLSPKSEFLQTYLLSGHLVLEGGMLIFMDSNRFFMVGVTFIRLL